MKNETKILEGKSKDLISCVQRLKDIESALLVVSSLIDQSVMRVNVQMNDRSHPHTYMLEEEISNLIRSKYKAIIPEIRECLEEERRQIINDWKGLL